MENSKPTIIDKIVNWIARSPKKSLAICCLMLMALLPGLKNIQTDYGVRLWFNPDDEARKQFDFYLDTFGNDDDVIIILDNKKGIFNKETLSDIREITNRLWKVQDVVRVDSLANFNHVEAIGDEVLIDELIHEDVALDPDNVKRIKKIAMGHETIPGTLISRDGTSTILIATLKPLFGKQPNHAPIIKQVNDIINDYEHKSDYEFRRFGSATITETFRTIAETDIEAMMPLLIVLIFVILVFLFRRVMGVAIPFAIIGATIAGALGISGYFGVKLNNISAMVPNILIAICIADAVHLIVTYYKFAKFGQDQARKTLEKNFLPTLLTSFSTSIGFAGLGLASLIPIKNFGYLCAAGTMLAWLFSILAIVPLLEIFKGHSQVTPKNIGAFPYADKLASTIIQHPKKIVVGFVALVGLGAFWGLKNEVNSNPFDYFSKSTELYQSNQHVLNVYEGLNRLDLVVDSQKSEGIHDPDFLKKADRYQNWINSLAYVNRSTSVVDISKQVNRSFNMDSQEFYKVPTERQTAAQNFLFYTMGLPQGQDINSDVSLDQRYMRIEIFWNIQDSNKSIAEAQKIVDYGKKLGLNVFATGQEYLFQGMNNHVVRTYFTSIIVSLILICILMIFVFKSLKLGIISLFPNIVPIIHGAGAMTLASKPIDVGTVLVASVCFGIAIDDTIHFISEFSANQKSGLKLKDNFVQIFNNTGVALTSTTLILVAGFGVFAFADFIPNFNFGVFSAFVLFIALVTDLLFLPALLVLTNGKEKIMS